MIQSGILNPRILELLARIRHTNMLVIADRGFPYWPMIETVDISLVADVPTVLQVFHAIRANFLVGQVYMAEEFRAHNGEETRAGFAQAFQGLAVTFEPHEAVFKKRVPDAIGLIRTGDATPYSNLILVSA